MAAEILYPAGVEQFFLQLRQQMKESIREPNM